jgi:alanine racemase
MREIQVDLAKIQSNYRQLKSLVAPSDVMAIVKANAYGHGMHEVAQALEEISVDALGVADLEEAIALRAAGIKSRLMCWILSAEDDFEMAAEQDIELGVSNFAVLEAALSTNVKTIHIKVDTGLGRAGFAQSQWSEVFEKLAGKTIGLFSHLANTSEEEDRKQEQLFLEAEVTAVASGVKISQRHLAATAGALGYPSMRYEMVRCGIGIYGLNPWDDREYSQYQLQPAMRAVSEVVNLKRVPAGQGVSYGYRYRTDRETTLALVPFGYSEGMPRIAVGAKVLIAGKQFEISGRVAMDQFVVDVGDHDVSLGSEVVIFGDPAKGEPSADELGASAGTINYEIVTRIGGRAKRVYL